MTPATRHKYPEFAEAVAGEVSPALEGVDFEELVDQLVAWSEKQKPALEQRHNASRTTISYAIPENDVLVWRVAPRMKDGAKVEVLPRDSSLLPARASAFGRPSVPRSTGRGTVSSTLHRQGCGAES